MTTAVKQDTSAERWSVALRQLAMHHIVNHPDCPRLEEILAIINAVFDPTETDTQSGASGG